MYEAVITCSNAFSANSSVKCLRSFSTKIATRAGARYALLERKSPRGGGDAMAFGGALVCEGGAGGDAGSSICFILLASVVAIPQQKVKLQWPGA
jgi:hypothetical protein